MDERIEETQELLGDLAGDLQSEGPSLPEDFHFGNATGKGTPALAFCRALLALIRQAHQELET